MPSPTRQKRPGRALEVLLGSGVAVLAAVIGLAWGLAGEGERGPVVYGAAAVRPVVEPLLKRYEAECGVAAALQVGPSGALEAQIRLSQRGDLFVPAAGDPFLDRLEAAGLVRERTRLARMRLVIALAPDVETRPDTLSALIGSGLPYGVCNRQAAAGQKTREAARRAGLWTELNRNAVASLPTVTELAAAVRDGGRLRAGLVWRVTAQQFGLTVLNTPELTDAVSEVEVGVLSTTKDQAAATRLARFLAEQARAFQAAGYEPP